MELLFFNRNDQGHVKHGYCHHHGWKCGFFGQILKIFSINSQDPLKIFDFCQNCVPHPLKKLIKFTRISRTVGTFAKKTEIGQNTENFHPWKYKVDECVK